MEPSPKDGIKARLKKDFPQFWFSVVRECRNSYYVSIVYWPIDLCSEAYTGPNDYRYPSQETKEEKNQVAKKQWYYSINEYHTERYTYQELFDRMIKIINRDNRDNSDSQSDYFDVWFYLHITVGKRNRPYVIK